MQRKVSIRVSGGSGNLRENRLLGEKVPAHAHDRLRESSDQIGTELFVCNKIQGGSQGGYVIVRDRRSPAQCAFGNVETFISTFGFRDGPGGIDPDQYRQRL